MQKEKFDRIISFLLGASWAIIIFGALITFNFFSPFGFPFAFFVTTVFIVVSFFLVLALDAFSINREKLYEAKKQSELLEKIYSKHTK